MVVVGFWLSAARKSVVSRCSSLAFLAPYVWCVLSSSKSQDGWTLKGPFFVEELVGIMLDFSCQKLHFLGG